MPHLATCIFILFNYCMNQDWVQESILAWLWNHFHLALGSNPRPFDHEPSALPLDHSFCYMRPVFSFEFEPPVVRDLQKMTSLFFFTPSLSFRKYKKPIQGDFLYPSSLKLIISPELLNQIGWNFSQRYRYKKSPCRPVVTKSFTLSPINFISGRPLQILKRFEDFWNNFFGLVVWRITFKLNCKIENKGFQWDTSVVFK